MQNLGENAENIAEIASQNPPETTPTIPEDDRIGQLVDNRYEIIDKIASGGMAVVYKALDRRLDRIVALKIMHSHLAAGPESQTFVDRFLREARAAAKLHHSGIVTVFDQGIDQSTVFLVMEFVDGNNLRKRLKEVGTFSLGDALKNTESILRALGAAHRSNLVHRDIKPENILINKRGELQLADFGLARLVTELTASTTGSVFGTVSYLAPEIIETGQSDTRADCYAVGIILYEMLTGFQPYEGSTPIQVAYKHVNEDIPKLSTLFPAIPEAISHFVEALCSRNHEKRPENAEEALKLLSESASTLTAAELAIKLPKPSTIPSQESQNDNAGDLYGQTSSSQTSQNASQSANENINPQNQQFAIPASLSSSSVSSSSAPTQIIPSSRQEIPSFAPSQLPQSTGPVYRAFAPENTGSNLATNLLTKDQLQQVRTAISGKVPRVPRSTSSTASNTSSYKAAELLTSTGSHISLNNSRKLIKSETARKRLTLVLSIVLVCVIAVGGAIWFFLAGPMTKVAIPEGLTGIDKNAATKILDEAGLHYELRDDFSDTVPQNVVISADPKSGEKISKRIGSVKLSVSKGVQMIEVPKSIVGTDFTDAVKQITKNGFAEPEIHREYSTSVPKDKILAINFPEGSSQRHDIKIELKVSDGPRPVTMPNIIGSSLPAATAQLEKLGLKIETTQDFSDTVKIGEIVSQESKQGDALHEGDTVKAVVSKGSKMVVVPDVVRLGKDAAAKALAEAGLKYAFAGEKQKLNIVQEQSVKAGEKVERDTVVTLTIV